MSDETLDTIALSFVIFIAFVALLISYYIDNTEQLRYKAYMEQKHGITMQD